MANKLPTARQSRRDADRRIGQADRCARALKILELIQGNGRWTAAALAAELGVSERTIYRYLDVLTFAGVPYWFDREHQCYRVRADYRFTPVQLQPEELLGQAIATSLSTATGLRAGATAAAATRKLSATIDDDGRKLLEDASRLIRILDLKLVDSSRHCEVIETLQWALIRGRQLVVRYASPYQPRPQQVHLHPYRLCLVRQAWYLIARRSDEAEPKTYRVSRFTKVAVKDMPASVPDDFDLDAYLGNAWSVYRGTPTYDVEILFAPEAASQMAETKWHPTQRVVMHRDGSAMLHVRVDGLDEIVWWLLGWAPFARVVQPKKLREMLVGELQAALARNSKDAT